MNESYESENRRPLKVRNTNFSKKVTAWLNNQGITPNQISITSIFFSGIAAISFLLIPSANDINVFILHIVAALFIQLRLLCNLFDGMVAIEGGKATSSGELFNDIPDRIADPLILVGLGYAPSKREKDQLVIKKLIIFNS